MTLTAAVRNGELCGSIVTPVGQNGASARRHDGEECVILRLAYPLQETHAHTVCARVCAHYMPWNGDAFFDLS